MTSVNVVVKAVLLFFGEEVGGGGGCFESAHVLMHKLMEPFTPFWFRWDSCRL